MRRAPCSSRLAFALDAPRISVIMTTPASPANSRPTKRGTRIGFLAPSSAPARAASRRPGPGYYRLRCRHRGSLRRMMHGRFGRVCDMDERPHARTSATSGNLRCGPSRTAARRARWMCPGHRRRRSAARFPRSSRPAPLPRGSVSPRATRASRGPGTDRGDLLALDRAAVRARPAAVTLGHEPPHPDRLPGREQVVGPSVRRRLVSAKSRSK